MNNLDNQQLIKRLDKSEMLKSIGWLYKQCQQVWDDTQSLHVPANYKNVKNIVLNGMGGSALGTHIIKSLYNDKLALPLDIINSYTVPASVNKDTLYIISSYSGNTEEPVGTLQTALKRKAKVMLIGGGGKLAQYKRKYKLPGYIFEPKYNPSGQPRIGLGYSIFGQWVLFSKLGLISLSAPQAKKIITFCKNTFKKFDAGVKNNQAKKIAKELHGFVPAIVASEHLVGNAHTFANQVNENAKVFSAYYAVSEMNHHLLEGLRFPKTLPKNLRFILFESALYHKRNQKRYDITKTILKKHKIPFSSYRLTAKDKVLQSFEMLIVGSCISFYLSMLNNINPSPIPVVDFFKDKLAQ